MKHLLQSPTAIKRHILLSAIYVGCLTLAGCSSNTSTSSSPTGSPSTKTTTPPPYYPSEHIEKNLIPASRIAKGLRRIKVTFRGARDNKVTSCSLSEITLPGDPEIFTRQLIKNNHPPTETHYVQLIARYEDIQGANSAFQKIQKKARSCPSKQNVSARRTDRGTTVLPHKDTWNIEEGMIAGWRHLRGHERRVFPRSMTKYNIYFVMHDYAVRGNVVVCTYYSERREPGKSGDPIAKRATEILTEQLQMFG